MASITIPTSRIRIIIRASRVSITIRISRVHTTTRVSIIRGMDSISSREPKKQNGCITRKISWWREQKHVFVRFLPILKAPVTRVKEIADSNNPAVGIEFIATKMVVCLLFLLIVLLKIRGAVSGYSSYIDIKIPYLKSILCVILATAGIDVIDALLLKVITALFGAKASFQAYEDSKDWD